MEMLSPQVLRVVIEQEDDGRWIADVVDLPGGLAYASDPGEAVRRAQVLALRVLADRLECDKSALLPAISFAIPPQL